MPAGLPVEFTAQAREALGPDKLLVIGLGLDPDPMFVVDSAHEHLFAGADHVTILPPLGGDFGIGIDQLEKIAPALTGLG
jgi:hypothetical protein